MSHLHPEQSHAVTVFYFRRDDRIVVIVDRRKSEPLLSFCELGPSYISANTDDGKKDYEAFFAEEEEEEVIEPDEPEATAQPEVSMADEDSVSYTYERVEKFQPQYDTLSEISALERLPEVPAQTEEVPPPPEQAPPPAEEVPTVAGEGE